MLSNSSRTTAIILCGGRGKRLGGLGKKINKTLICYNNKPLIFYIIKYLEKFKVNDVIIPLGFKGGQISEYLRKSFKNKNLKFFNAGVNTNVTNRIKKSIKFISEDAENIIILNGDSFYQFNLQKLINSKLQKKKIFVNLICTKLRLDYGFVINKNKKLYFNYKNQYFKKFLDLKHGINYFYSGVCAIEKNYLLKYLPQIKDNFETYLFNKAAIKNKLNFIYDNNFFFQINYHNDLKVLNEKKKK
jgi:glucose-1-phosphate cytidylyltransferase